MMLQPHSPVDRTIQHLTPAPPPLWLMLGHVADDNGAFDDDDDATDNDNDTSDADNNVDNNNPTSGHIGSDNWSKQLHYGPQQ